jgi:hypothetical protein
MQTLNKNNTMQLVSGLLLLMLMTGCAEWNSVPVVVDQNFGNAYHAMVKNQTLYPEHGQTDKPILSLDGQKAQGVINAYRVPAQKPLEDAKKGPTFTLGVGASSAGGN